LLYSREHIQKVVNDISEQVNAYYDKIQAQEETVDLVVVCVLKGSFMFYADLVRNIRHHHLCEFIKCRSYEGTESTGKIALSEPLKAERYQGKHVLVVEDMHDTGATLKGIVAMFQEVGAKTVEVAVMVIRPDRPLQVDIRFKGLECSDFIIGYGLDFDENGRSLPDIYQKVG
jgi:hypoxanthine phosphoribosyltransferase